MARHETQTPVEAAMKISLQIATIIVLMTGSALAQWKNVPPEAIPRTGDGKLNLSAPAPRLPDGKPDLSGVWNLPPPPGYLQDLAKDIKESLLLSWR